MAEGGKSFFHTIPGILTGLASLVAALTGLFVALSGDNSGNVQAPAATTVLVPAADVGQAPAAAPAPAAPASDTTAARLELEKLREQRELEKARLERERERLAHEREMAKIQQEADQAAAERAARQETGQRRESGTPVSNADINGRWLATLMGTYTFIISQDQELLYVEEYDPVGNFVGEGEGTIRGRTVNLRIIEETMYTPIHVRMELELSNDGSRLTGNIYSQGQVMAITLVRS